MNRILALFFAVAVGVFSLAAEAQSLGSTIAAYEGMTLGEAAPVSNLKLTSGHMTFTLTSGSAVPVTAGADTIGLFFVGKGTYEYVTSDPTEHAIVKYNTKKASDLGLAERAGALVISDSFEQLLFIQPGGPLPSVGGTAGVTVDAAKKDFDQFFARDRGTPPAHLYAMKKLDNPAGTLTMAQIRGGREPAIYVYDDVLRHSESLSALRNVPTDNPLVKKYLFRTTISDQLINRNRKEYAVQNFFLSAVDIDLTASDKKEAHYTAVETVVPQGKARRLFRFDLYNDVVVGMNDVRTFRVKSLSDPSGKPLEFSHRNDEIVVALPAALPANQAAQLKFEVEGDFLFRPSGDSYWELGVAPWFPQPELGEMYYTFHAVTRVKKPFIALSPGVTVRREVEGDYNVVETRIDQPVQFAAILAGRYYFAEDTRDGLTVRVASYAQNDQIAFKKLANLAHQMIDYMEFYLGPFPFTEFNIIEKNDYRGGQAPPATMFITKVAFNPHDDLMSQMFSRQINHIFAHEIAHQYWGHVVKMPSGEEQWLTESFAEYSAALVMKKHKGQRYFDGVVKIWKGYANQATESSSIAMANRLGGDFMIAGQNRRFLVYDKGAYLLSQIHKEIGDDQFLTFLKSYQKTFRWKYGSTQHVAGMLQFVTKKDFSAFFDENYWGTGMPK